MTKTQKEQSASLDRLLQAIAETAGIPREKVDKAVFQGQGVNGKRKPNSRARARRSGGPSKSAA